MSGNFWAQLSVLTFVLVNPVTILLAFGISGAWVVAICGNRLMHRLRVKHKRVVVSRLDACPVCGNEKVDREPAGAQWRIWCARCYTLSLAGMAPDAMRSLAPPEKPR
jgi:ribosomal protein L37AE/L43A